MERVTTEACNVSLHEKLAVRSGRLQLLVAAMTDLAFVLGGPADEETVNGALLPLAEMAGNLGAQWCEETSALLKTLYNRTQGP